MKVKVDTEGLQAVAKALDSLAKELTRARTLDEDTRDLLIRRVSEELSIYSVRCFRMLPPGMSTYV